MAAGTPAWAVQVDSGKTEYLAVQLVCARGCAAFVSHMQTLVLGSDLDVPMFYSCCWTARVRGID